MCQVSGWTFGHLSRQFKSNQAKRRPPNFQELKDQTSQIEKRMTNQQVNFCRKFHPTTPRSGAFLRLPSSGCQAPPVLTFVSELLELLGVE